MLLAPLNESDIVEVMETRDGTGTFIAHIRILRFRLRMRVSKCVVVEFVASGKYPCVRDVFSLKFYYTERVWALRFAVVTETSPDGRTENKWVLSLELGEQSPVVAVEADLFIEGSVSQVLESRDFEDPLLSISFGSTSAELWPGRENAITVRLDEGPMGPHLLNECVTIKLSPFCHTHLSTRRSSVLVDAKGTLCAQLNARLTRPVPAFISSDTSSSIIYPARSQETYPAQSQETYPARSLETPFSEFPQPPSTGKKGKEKKPKEKRVYTSLRRGGHG